MNGMKFSLFAAALLFALPASAQSTRYDVKTLNFDMWCQETARINPDRCDKRLPDDEKQFEAYRAKIEKYEVPYLAAQGQRAAVRSGRAAQRSGRQSDLQDPAAQQQTPPPPRQSG